VGESYLRHLINDLIPTDQPPPDYFGMVRRLNAIGRNLNQIAKKAHIDAERYEGNVSALGCVYSFKTHPRERFRPLKLRLGGSAEFDYFV